MNDSTLITISWDTTTETHTVAALREKFGKTNLFAEDGVWSRPLPWKRGVLTFAQAPNLNTVLSVIQPGEEWTCDNCTVTLAEVLTHDEQEMSQPENVLADHDWNDMDDDADMLDSIISMLDGMDADRMAAFLMGMQDALAGKTATNGEASDYAAGHGRIMECIDATISATVDVQDQLNGGAQ